MHLTWPDVYSNICSTSIENDGEKVETCSNTAYGVVTVTEEHEYEMIKLQQTPGQTHIGVSTSDPPH